MLEWAGADVAPKTSGRDSSKAGNADGNPDTAADT